VEFSGLEDLSDVYQHDRALYMNAAISRANKNLADIESLKRRTQK